MKYFIIYANLHYQLVYNSNPYKSRALGFLHLFLAVLSIIYLTASLFVELENVTPAQQEFQKFCRYALVFCAIIDLLLGIYVQPATNKVLLFFQAMASMLLFSAHLFFVYAYFTANGTGIIDAQSSLDFGMIFIFISALLHATNFWPVKNNEDENIDSINISDDLFDDNENYYE